jgi:hypothetical protein
MSIPNVEAVTAILFTAGYTLGAVRGVAAAVVAAIMYFGFNPQGGLFPPLLAAQIIGISAAPLAGALFKRINARSGLKSLYLAVTAIIVTLWYDILTNLAFPLAVGFDLSGIFITLIAAIPFSAIHLVSNVAIFMILVPQLLKVILRRFPLVEK